MHPIFSAIVLLALTSLVGCASFKSDVYQAVRYDQFHDSAPVAPPDLDQVPDAIPRYEPPSAGGNSPVYQVRGKKYRVLEQAKGFTEEGNASWYGQKFHGHKTSNGEIYNMYTMSAAHKHLPLPTFAKITRLDNGKQVIVRINDRGPFHEDRIIDLSYAAAHRLDMLNEGTAKVRIDAITAQPPWQSNPVMDANSLLVQTAAVTGSATLVVTTPTSGQRSAPNALPPHWYVQVTATADPAKAKALESKLKQELDLSVRTISEPHAKVHLHKIQLGPVFTEAKADELVELLRQREFSSAFKVYVQ